MKLIRPITIDGAALDSSNVVETAPAAYNGATTYALGNQVSVFSGINSTVATMYESLQASNTGNTPSSSPLWWQPIGTAYLAWNSGTAYLVGAIVTDTTSHLLYESVQNGTNHVVTDPAYWVELGPTNKWAMFDQKTGTLTTRPLEIDVDIDVSGRIDTVALFNVDASNVHVEVWAGDDVRTNLLLRSAEFDNASWIKTATATVSANTTMAPDETVTADTINLPASGDRVHQQISATGSTAYVFSCWLAGSGTVYLTLNTSGGTFKTATVQITLTATLTRYTLAITTNGDNTGLFAIVGRYNGAGGAGTATSVIAWGAQVEVGAEATQYIPTEASTVTVTGQWYYDEDHSLVSSEGITDWYAYFFEPIERNSDLLVQELPNVLDPVVMITATDTDDVSIGHCVVGLSRDLGGTQYGASVGITDYSRKTQDDFGNWYLVERGFNKNGRFQVWMEKAATDFVHKLLSLYRATPIVLIGSDEYTSTYIFGLLKDWRIEISYPSHSVMSIEVEGL